MKGFPLIQCGPALLFCDSLDSLQLPQDPKTDKWLRKWSLWIDLNCLLYAKLQKKKKITATGNNDPHFFNKAFSRSVICRPI